MRALLLPLALIAVPCMAAAQTPPVGPSGPGKPPSVHKPRPAKPADAPALQADATPQPEQPKWPVNEAPAQPKVTWDSQGLHIHAANSSLTKILDDVSSQTGAKIEGVGADERIFGDYGPGPARDVLSQLLHGSNYDFLMLGDQGQGTPRQLILTARQQGAPQVNHPTAPTPANQSMPEPEPDEEPTVDQPDQEDMPQPIQPTQPTPPPTPPQGEEMTPQQRMELMQQQRLQQMQQLQQQYQQQQQQQQQQQEQEQPQ